MMRASAWLWCCLAALPVMMKQQSGSIVNVGSQSTRGLYRLPYATSKGGILALTKVLAMEYGRHGIRINAMAPGGTEITDRVVPRQFIKPGMTVEEPDDEAAYRREMGEDIRNQQALKRRGLPEEQAAAIAFLAAEHYEKVGLPITGEVIAARLKVLSDTDRIEGIGDLRMWRHSEVRLKDGPVN